LKFPSSGGWPLECWPSPQIAHTTALVRLTILITRPSSCHVFDEASGEGRAHVLNHGYHRLAASIAVGFTQVPAVTGMRTLDEIKRAENMT